MHPLPGTPKQRRQLPAVLDQTLMVQSDHDPLENHACVTFSLSKLTLKKSKMDLVFDISITLVGYDEKQQARSTPNTLIR